MGLNQCRQQVSPEEGDRVIDAFLVLKIDVGVARAVGLIVEENWLNWTGLKWKLLLSTDWSVKLQKAKYVSLSQVR